MFGFGSKKIGDGLIKKIVVNGILFKIKKIDPIDHLKGLKVMQTLHSLYFSSNKEVRELTDGEHKKVREHYKDVFLSSVIHPSLSRENKEGFHNVEEIILDQELAEKLYMEIMVHTYGKKKIKYTDTIGHQL